ncbi:hypothetical protein BU17DRAFT_69593 [Hysterangium stoloniferum]|nr:hypothetical protein BU17DRAFT_69593 [Hysterangium stoloniferum]
MCDVLMEHFEKNWSIVRPRDGSSKYPQSKIEQPPYDIHLSIFNALQVDDAVSLAITCWFEDWDEDSGILPPAAMVPGSHDWRIFQEIVDKRSPLGHNCGSRLEEMGVTQAILSRICWSHDPSSSMAYQGDIHRGTWAGDRIHIMCENRHDVVLMAEAKVPSKAPWKDVTEANIEELSLLNTLSNTKGVIPINNPVYTKFFIRPTFHWVKRSYGLITIRHDGQNRYWLFSATDCSMSSPPENGAWIRTRLKIIKRMFSDTPTQAINGAPWTKTELHSTGKDRALIAEALTTLIRNLSFEILQEHGPSLTIPATLAEP